MKRIVLDFVRRGLTACGLGPLVLAVFYLLLYHQTGLETLNVREVCQGIFSLSALAFVAGGMNALYQIEQLPLMLAIFIHGSVLYAGYLGTYLLNNWLKWEIVSVAVFTGIFILGYFLIWGIIWLIIKRKTEKLNRMLRQKQQNPDKP